MGYTDWERGTVWDLLASRPCRLRESVKPGEFSNTASLSCCSTIIRLFLYFVLSNLSISRSRSWVLTRLLMRWGKGSSLPVPWQDISIQRRKTYNTWKKRSVNNRPRRGTSSHFLAWKIGEFHIWCDFHLRHWLTIYALANVHSYKMGCHTPVTYIRACRTKELLWFKRAPEMSQDVLSSCWSVPIPVASSVEIPV